MQSEDSYITLSDCHVPIPAPNPAMKELVRILRAIGFIIYVISASNDATDLEFGIRSSFPAKIARSGSGTVAGRRLLDYARLLPDADLSLKFLENDWASITCGRSRTRIAGISRESFPELPQMPEAAAEIPVRVLSSMIGKTIFAISAEESRFTLNGALLQLRESGMLMVATDGHRLAYVEGVGEIPGIRTAYRALLPRKAMVRVLKTRCRERRRAVVKFAGDENHLFFYVRRSPVDQP